MVWLKLTILKEATPYLYRLILYKLKATIIYAEIYKLLIKWRDEFLMSEDVQETNIQNDKNT